MSNTTMTPAAAADKAAMTDQEKSTQRAADAHKARDEASKNQEAAKAANAEAAKLAVTAHEARAAADAEVDPSKKAAAMKAANEAAQKADDAKAKAAEADRKAAGQAPMTVDEAKVMAPVPMDMTAGDHLAQKFGNDPANPKSIPFALPNGQSVPVDSNVRLSRKTPDHPGLVYTSCQPNMVGDYLRAGWNVDDVQPVVDAKKDDSKPATA